MKALKWLVIVLAIYVGLVVVFESLLGYFQPANEATLTITTTDSDGGKHQRVLARLESAGKVYVAANHWPRGWYNRALQNPDVEITYKGETQKYKAVPIEGAEHQKVDSDNSLGPIFRVLTGFPPRYFVRLDPV